VSPRSPGRILGAAALLAVVACQPPATAPDAAAALPDWSGIWISAEPVAVIDVDGYPQNFNPVTDWKVIGMTAPLNDATRAKAMEALQSAQRLVSFKAPSWGFPLMMESPTALQFLITPKETLILNFYRDTRHIYTDGRSLPSVEDRWPGPWGESIGRWEGDTLVIETVSVARPGVTGLPFPFVSEDAVYVERVRMVDPDRIELQMTVTDPGTLAEPWTFQVAYKRAPNMDRMFHMPFDNDRSAPADDGLFTIAPTATE
jgi:hypothetical protein